MTTLIDLFEQQYLPNQTIQKENDCSLQNRDRVVWEISRISGEVIRPDGLVGVTMADVAAGRAGRAQRQPSLASDSQPAARLFARPLAVGRTKAMGFSLARRGADR